MEKQQQEIYQLQNLIQDLSVDKQVLDALYHEKLREIYQLRKHSIVLQSMIATKDKLINEANQSNSNLGKELQEKNVRISDLLSNIELVEDKVKAIEGIVENSQDAILDIVENSQDAILDNA